MIDIRQFTYGHDWLSVPVTYNHPSGLPVSISQEQVNKLPAPLASPMGLHSMSCDLVVPCTRRMCFGMRVVQMWGTGDLNDDMLSLA